MSIWTETYRQPDEFNPFPMWWAQVDEQEAIEQEQRKLLRVLAEEEFELEYPLGIDAFQEEAEAYQQYLTMFDWAEKD